ncbi:IS3 family transposase [Peribacillus simplex]|uniref:HTH-like domain-containing protein n=2 Tax=Peribacillus simplex TaxID=1478 RepID=A0A9W4PJR6_9BACI|nr:hypothetical protein SRABI133_05156 [Peribacillus simplex]
MARSTYYYWINAFGREDKYTEIKSLIKEIFHTHKGRYRYRRITLELRNRGARINHKTVLRLMNELGLKSLVRFKQELEEYIHYYNHQRIKVKLKHTKISSADQGIGPHYYFLYSRNEE